MKNNCSAAPRPVMGGARHWTVSVRLFSRALVRLALPAELTCVQRVRVSFVLI